MQTIFCTSNAHTCSPAGALCCILLNIIVQHVRKILRLRTENKNVAEAKLVGLPAG